MKLGILVNTDKCLGDIVEITRSATKKGHEVIIFAMDKGTLLLEQPDFSGLCNVQGVQMSFCSHNAEKFGAKTEGLPGEIICGSQYNNAQMMHNADRVIVL
ncbi:MAG TPA: hypothetical protein ENK09_06995 [Nitrospirae bacterium]|nr:hypothetical protein [Nitrospirota bacterium]